MPYPPCASLGGRDRERVEEQKIGSDRTIAPPVFSTGCRRRFYVPGEHVPGEHDEEEAEATDQAHTMAGQKTQAEQEREGITMSAQEQVDRLAAYLSKNKLHVGALGGAGDIAIMRLDEMASVEKGTQDFLKQTKARVGQLGRVVLTHIESMSVPPDEYLRGMANGLILALHTIEGRGGTPDYIDAPEGGEAASLLLDTLKGRVEKLRKANLASKQHKDKKPDDNFLYGWYGGSQEALNIMEGNPV